MLSTMTVQDDAFNGQGNCEQEERECRKAGQQTHRQWQETRWHSAWSWSWQEARGTSSSKVHRLHESNRPWCHPTSIRIRSQAWLPILWGATQMGRWSIPKSILILDWQGSSAQTNTEILHHRRQLEVAATSVVNWRVTYCSRREVTNTIIRCWDRWELVVQSVDFIVYTYKGFHLEHIAFDWVFWSSTNQKKLESFYFTKFLLELCWHQNSANPTEWGPKNC